MIKDLLKQVVKSTLSKPENPFNTGNKTTATAVIAAPSIGLTLSLMNEMGVETLSQAIVGCIGILLSYALSQYKDA